MCTNMCTIICIIWVPQENLTITVKYQIINDELLWKQLYLRTFRLVNGVFFLRLMYKNYNSLAAALFNNRDGQ